MQPIQAETWKKLVRANQAAVASGWALPGVFGTGIGPDYVPGQAGTLLYVGKSAGPLGSAVGSTNDLTSSSAASTHWMMSWSNERAFWQFINPIVPKRRTMAWSNICKMDQINPRKPPTDRMWRDVADASIAALRDEIAALAPHITLFVSNRFGKHKVDALLAELGYVTEPTALDGLAHVSQTADGRYAIQTRHPQGWDKALRDTVRSFVINLLNHSPAS
jgi:hypothetical protein